MKTILLVEDDPFITNVYATWLKKDGYRVDIARDSQMALEKIKNNYPDLVILDLKMPKNKNSVPSQGEGWEILRNVRNDVRTKDLKVIIVSNINQKDYPNDAPTLRVIKYFLKVETTPEEMANAVREILK